MTALKTKSNCRRSLLLTCYFTCFTAIALAQQISDRKQIESLIAKSAAKLELDNNSLNGYRVSDTHFDEMNGIIFIYLQQTYKGYDVNRAVQTVVAKNDSITYIAGQRFNTGNAMLNTYQAKPAVTAANAVHTALLHLNLALKLLPVAAESNEQGSEIKFGNLTVAQNNITAKLLWLPDNAGKKLSLCWQVQIQPFDTPDFWLVYTDAVTGAVLVKENLAVKCVWDKQSAEPRYFADYTENKEPNSTHIPQAFDNGGDNINSVVFNVIKFPAASPSHAGGSPAPDTNPWERVSPGSGADNYKWNADDLNTYDYTRGNNVQAQEDVNHTNGGRRATSSTMLPNLTFNFTFDSTREPVETSNQNFAITNLFYWTNIMHDISFIYGFNEASGNFQQNNKHSAGIDGDLVYADAQDGSGANNASFLTPPDGQSPRMQLSLFNGTPKRDPDLDNAVICHEYTHGISNRLVGGASIVTCLQNEEQMGEGWSDYFALMLTTDWATAKPGDGINKRPIATYSLAQPPDGTGVRIHPYSTDMAIDPWTYADLPNVPTTGGYPSPHAVGEIWCSALWDITWALIDEQGITPNIYNTNGTGGNIIALKLVTTAMKLTPCSPGFFDAKRALVQADNLLFNQKYDCLIKKSFARRGMGAYLVQGSTLSYKDGAADFTDPISAKVFLEANKDTVAEGDLVTYELIAKGSACGGVIDYKATDTLPPQLVYSSGGIYDAAANTVSFNNIELGEYENDTLYFTAAVKGGTYYDPVIHVNEQVIAPHIPSGWITYNIAGTNTFTANSLAYSAPYAFYVSEPDTYSVSLLQVQDSFLLTGKSTLSFWHNYTTENLYDGGVAEISTDNGTTWTDLGDYFTLNGYDTTISGLYGSYLAGRKAFSGKSLGYIQSIADLTSFKGQYVKIRFLFATDNGGLSKGWNIDDIIIKSEAAVDNKVNMLDSLGNFIFSFNAVSLILPGLLAEKWELFTAEKSNGAAVLQWQFLQTGNLSKFSIERSADGNRFAAIGTVQAANGGKYSFTDDRPLQAANYYRIKQISADGHAYYSAVKQLNFSGGVIATVSPNPAKNKLFISFNGNLQPVNITLCSIAGNIIKTYTLNGNSAVLSLPKLAAGMYVLKITAPAFTSTHKIIIE